MPKKDGCPRCLKRDNEPQTWNESTGKATYRCACGHAWSTWWEHEGVGNQPDKLGRAGGQLLSQINQNRKAQQ